jgi:hypothetical protein
MGVTTGKMAFQPNIVTNGLVLNLDAINPNSYPQSGTIWYDTSGNNNNGTLTNGTAWTPNGSQTSFSFDGVDDYATTPNNNSSYFVSSNFTISVWTNVSNVGSGFRGIFGCFDDNQPNINFTGFSFWIRTGENRFSFVVGSGVSFAFIPADSNYQINEWYNLTGVNTEGVSYFYVNGVLQNTTSGLTIAPPQYPVKIGRTYANTNNYYYNGKISNGVIYTKALSASEVLQNYNALKTRFGLS